MSRSLSLFQDDATLRAMVPLQSQENNTGYKSKYRRHYVTRRALLDRLSIPNIQISCPNKCLRK
jgi:hypothetical protein